VREMWRCGDVEIEDVRIEDVEKEDVRM